MGVRADNPKATVRVCWIPAVGLALEATPPFRPASLVTKKPKPDFSTTDPHLYSLMAEPVGAVAPKRPVRTRAHANF
jgi:hypothetical protein